MASIDFPQLWQRPTFQSLLDLLEGLKLGPPRWNHDERRRSDVECEHEAVVSRSKADINRYLSAIIKSPLAWIEDEEQREEIWEAASRRLSERCGRTAMGEISRRWPFDSDEPFELVIREPALTGDALGLKTWASSYLLSRHLPRLASASLAGLLGQSRHSRSLSVLELGSGTGLLGLAVAALWKVPVWLSDLPEIVPNLRKNVETNKALVLARGGSPAVGTLIWGKDSGECDSDEFSSSHQFQIILAADPLYDDDHPVLLASTISRHLALEDEARAVVMVPDRDAATVRLRETLKLAMSDLQPPIFCDEEAELVGQDDWVEDDEGGRVVCWLGIFSRNRATSRPT